MYYLFSILQREVRSVKPFGCSGPVSPLARSIYRLAPATATLDSAPVRLGFFLASVKSYQVVPDGRRLTTWRTSGCAAQSWT